MTDTALEWLTVKEFAARVRMTEHGVREAIRKGTLAYPVERITTGKKGAIRIVVPTYDRPQSMSI